MLEASQLTRLIEVIHVAMILERKVRHGSLENLCLESLILYRKIQS